MEINRLAARLTYMVKVLKEVNPSGKVTAEKLHLLCYVFSLRSSAGEDKEIVFSRGADGERRSGEITLAFALARQKEAISSVVSDGRSHELFPGETSMLFVKMHLPEEDKKLIKEIAAEYGNLDVQELKEMIKGKEKQRRFE